MGSKLFLEEHLDPIAIECKLKADNFVVATDIDHSFKREYDGISVTFVNLDELIGQLQEA